MSRREKNCSSSAEADAALAATMAPKTQGIVIISTIVLEARVGRNGCVGRNNRASEIIEFLDTTKKKASE